MATLVPNEFSSYRLTQDEEVQGILLTNAQKQVLQNQLSQCASDKLNLTYTPNDPLVYAQKEAYLRGQIDAIKYILSMCENLEETLKSTQQE